MCERLLDNVNSCWLVNDGIPTDLLQFPRLYHTHPTGPIDQILQSVHLCAHAFNTKHWNQDPPAEQDIYMNILWWWWQLSKVMYALCTPVSNDASQ